jgi:hypothetical protein
MMCTLRPSAVVGRKPKLFTGRADGWVHRQYAYQLAGLPLCTGKEATIPDPSGAREPAADGGEPGKPLRVPCVRPHPLFPPRNVTVLDDDGMPGVFGGRALWNREEVLASVAATGLPWRFVPRFLDLEFAEQTRILAGTGVLVVPHAHPAAALAMLLPAHAALIELFASGQSGLELRNLAEMCDVHYFGVFARRGPLDAPSEDERDFEARETAREFKIGEGEAGEGAGAAAEAAARKAAAAKWALSSAGAAILAARAAAAEALQRSRLAAALAEGAPPLQTRSAAFWEACVAPNLTSTDLRAAGACRAAALSEPAVVPLEMLSSALRDAIDSTGAFSLLNPEWKARAPTEGTPIVKAADFEAHKSARFGING